MITFLQHRLNRGGGQERVALEILTRAARKGHHVEIISYELEDWPEELPVTWRKVPHCPIKIQLIGNIWFAVCSFFFLKLLYRNKSRTSVTAGTASLLAEVRIIHFLNAAFSDVLKSNLVLPPNPKSRLHILYQKTYSAHEGNLERLVLPHSKKIITVSDQVKKDVERRIFKNKPQAPEIITIRNGFDLEVTHKPLDQSFEKHLRPNTPLILFVGALERKGIKKSLQYLQGIQDLSWQFWAIGEGDINRWENCARDFGIKDRTMFFGRQASGPFFSKADIFLFPSVYEPFGLVVTEAMSHMLAPVVSSECGAMELWPNRPSWLQLSVEDIDEKWINALRKLLENPETRKTIAMEAHDSASVWTWENAAEEYLRVIESASAGSAKQ